MLGEGYLTENKIFLGQKGTMHERDFDRFSTF